MGLMQQIKYQFNVFYLFFFNNDYINNKLNRAWKLENLEKYFICLFQAFSLLKDTAFNY